MRRNLGASAINNQQIRARRYWYGLSRTGTQLLAGLLFFSLLTPTFFSLQAVSAQRPAAQSDAPPSEIFRLERVEVPGGAELVTIHARMPPSEPTTTANGGWVPLVSVLRDTLGDLNSENDRLRYVWPLTYTRPSLKQRLAGAVPFLYSRVGNRKSSSVSAPPAVLDLASPERDVWNRIFYAALQSLLLDPYGIPVKTSTRSYRQNLSDYRRSHIIRALSVLALYQAVEGPTAFTESELAEIQARLSLTDKTFGGLMGDLHLQRYSEKQITKTLDERGHNWELLRQRAEAESLYFEPLEMPDGSATHALLWVAKPDLGAKRNQAFNGRFLNIADPWTDKRLAQWRGYSELRHFGAESRPVSADAPGSREIEMIPLALYGLDNPKIPMVLVDFRDALNPKKREMSRRILEDVTSNVLSLSAFGPPAYFLGRSVFDFVTGRRGIDFNQPSRLRTYSQLKLLLSLNQSLDPKLKEQIDGKLEKVSLNPLENDLATESRLALAQYEALLAYAKHPDGLRAKLDRDRRAELVPLEHGKAARVFFRLSNILSFGKYIHRENPASDPVPLNERLDLARRLDFHTRFLLKVAQSTPQIEVIWSLGEVKRSLRFVAEHVGKASSDTITAASSVFRRTGDEETRRLCLDSLSRIDNPRAREELIRISKDQRLDQAGKDMISAFLLAHPKQRPNTVPLAASREKTGDVTGQQ